MPKIKRALVSVSDKSGILEFCQGLSNLGIEIVSTGGTSKLLKDNNVPVMDVSEVTGFPEMMNGRVKTLHPKIHGGILAVRDNPEHVTAMQEHDITGIDMVVVNLYPFEEVMKKTNVSLEELIENIDIGGPTMIRSAAKNNRDVTVVVSPDDYAKVLDMLKNNQLEIPQQQNLELAIKAFGRTAQYDTTINTTLAKRIQGE